MKIPKLAGAAIASFPFLSVVYLDQCRHPFPSLAFSISEFSSWSTVRLITQRLYLQLNKLDTTGVVWDAITFFRVVSLRPGCNSRCSQLTSLVHVPRKFHVSTFRYRSIISTKSLSGRMGLYPNNDYLFILSFIDLLFSLVSSVRSLNVLGAPEWSPRSQFDGIWLPMMTYST